MGQFDGEVPLTPGSSFRRVKLRCGGVRDPRRARGSETRAEREFQMRRGEGGLGSNLSDQFSERTVLRLDDTPGASTASLRWRLVCA